MNTPWDRENIKKYLHSSEEVSSEYLNKLQLIAPVSGELVQETSKGVKVPVIHTKVITINGVNTEVIDEVTGHEVTEIKTDYEVKILIKDLEDNLAVQSQQGIEAVAQIVNESLSGVCNFDTFRRNSNMVPGENGNEIYAVIKAQSAEFKAIDNLKIGLHTFTSEEKGTLQLVLFKSNWAVIVNHLKAQASRGKDFWENF